MIGAFVGAIISGNRSSLISRAVTISGSSAGAQTDYQLKITIPYEPSMQIGFGDIRFVSESGALLSYWIEAAIPSTSADFWVKIPAIPEAPGSIVIYLQYGTEASSLSSAVNTFISGSDFSQDDGFIFRSAGVDVAYGNSVGALRAQNFSDGLGVIWLPTLLQNAGRIDSIEYLGNGILVCGTRAPNTGYIFRSTNNGQTWSNLGRITGSLESNDINTIKSAGGGVAYLLTAESKVWKTTNYGATWLDMGKVSTNAAYGIFSLAYGLCVTDSGAVLVADTAGYIFRSTDGGSTWNNLGKIASIAFYRFDKVADGIIVNGWDRGIFKSTDDGLNWTFKGVISTTTLYATEYIGNGIVLQASDAGEIFRSTDNGETWTNLGVIGVNADDFAGFGNNIVVYFTYSTSPKWYRSADSGITWKDMGSIGANTTLDAVENGIYFNSGENRNAIAVSKYGFAYRSTDSGPLSVLSKIVVSRSDDTYAKKQLQSSIGNNFAVRIKFSVSYISSDAWIPIAAISTTGSRASDVGNNSIVLVKRGTGGVGIVEFRQSGSNPLYSPTTITEIAAPFSGRYIAEIRKTSTDSASLYVYNEDGTLIGSNSITVTSQQYNWIMAHIPTPTGWADQKSIQHIEYVLLRNYVQQEPSYSIAN